MPSYLVSAKEAFVPTQMYTPPIQSIGEILRIKQGRYDQGYNQLNSVYNSILNSEVLSADGNAKKKQYLEQADKTLQTLSQADLSLPENVKLGESVFKPFYEDQDLVREIGLVKDARKEISYGESLRTSTDEKARAEYNAFSIKDLNNQLKEISESSAEDRKMMGPRQYVKKVDISKEADAVLDKLGLKNSSIVENVDGKGYKVVNQFGKQSVLPLTDMFNSSLSSDARAYLQMMGRLQYRDVYETKLASANGDRSVARQMVADELIGSDVALLEKTFIPEMDRAKKDGESKIAALIAERKAQGSDLSADDLAFIEQTKDAIKKYGDKSAEYARNLKNLQDPESEFYKETRNNYTAQGNNVFTKQITSQYATAWARSRANFLNSIAVNEDKTWKNQQDIMMDAAKLQNDMNIAILNNQTKEEIATLKGTKSGTKTKNAAGENIGVMYAGQTGENKLISKADQYVGIALNLNKALVLPNIQLFEKTLADKTGIGSELIGKIYQAMQDGKGANGIFTAEEIRNKTPDYVAFKKLVDNSDLSGIKPGEKFTWSYDQAFKVIQNSVYSYIKSDEGKQVMKSIGDNELSKIDGFGWIYAAVKDGEKRVNGEILSNPKYNGYVVSDGGVSRLITPADLKKDTKIVLQEVPSEGFFSSLRFTFGEQKPKAAPRQVTVDMSQIKPGDLSADDNFASNPLITVNLNGKRYVAVGANDKEQRNNKANLALDRYRTNDLDGAMEVYHKNEIAKLRQLQKDFGKDFERIAPSLKLNLGGNNADAFNFGAVEYRFGDKDNPAEPGEQAAASLFSPENIKNRKIKFLGVESDDLKDDSPFMNLVNKVAAYLPELSGKNEVVGLRVEGYNNETGTPTYKLKLSENQIMDALNISKADLDDKTRKAIAKFQSGDFKVVAPNYDPLPGGLTNGLSPFESYVRSNGFKSGKLMEDLGYGSFEVKKLTGGGYRVKANVPVFNPNTKKTEMTPLQEGEDITLPDDADIVGAINNLYGIMRRTYNQSNALARKNPPVPKGTGVSVSSVEEQLRASGIIK